MTNFFIYDIILLDVVVMAYSSVFNTKPKKDNRLAFCKRIVKFLNEIELTPGGGAIYSGKNMLNMLFKFSPLNIGYSDINDLFNESDIPYADIFTLTEMGNSEIADSEILANIDIIANCIFSFENIPGKNAYFYDKSSAVDTISIMGDAIYEYLLSCGYKLIKVEKHFNIVENDIAVDLEDIRDIKTKKDIISFYDYKNENDIDEKKKIILNVIGKLESRKNDIENIFGSKIADTVANYANNINLRHTNSDVSYKKYYNKTVADLSNVELIEWYNYIFAFVLNIYIKLDTLKNININGGYK